MKIRLRQCTSLVASVLVVVFDLLGDLVAQSL